jgi:hypothetical protein
VFLLTTTESTPVAFAAEVDVDSAVEIYIHQVDGILGVVTSGLGELGAVLIDAGRALNNEKYIELTRYLNDRGFSNQEIDAAKAVARGELNPKLYFVGVKVSKVLKLDASDQDRLLNGERFELRQRNGLNLKKTWVEMSVQERNQLLGNVGRILSANEQTVPTVRTGQAKTTRYMVAKLDSDADVLRLENGQHHGYIQFGTLAGQLSEAERIRLGNYILEYLSE